MNKKIKIILTILILIGSYFLVKEFPDEIIFIFAIGLIILIGLWMLQAEAEQVT